MRKKSSRILNEMDVELALKIISGMKNDRAAEILGLMTPEKARALSEASLGRIPASEEKVSQKVNEKEVKPNSEGGEQ